MVGGRGDFIHVHSPRGGTDNPGGQSSVCNVCNKKDFSFI